VARTRRAFDFQRRKSSVRAEVIGNAVEPPATIPLRRGLQLLVGLAAAIECYFNDIKRRAGIGSKLHFHDLRGTAATKFYIAKLDMRVIAEILGWEEDYVSKIIRRYVGRAAATQAVIKQLNEARGKESEQRL
jgi:hypothetical protein